MPAIYSGALKWITTKSMGVYGLVLGHSAYLISWHLASAPADGARLSIARRFSRVYRSLVCRNVRIPRCRYLLPGWAHEPSSRGPGESVGDVTYGQDYSFTYCITRLSNVQVVLCSLLDDVMRTIGARTELEAIAVGVRSLRAPSPRQIGPDIARDRAGVTR